MSLFVRQRLAMLASKERASDLERLTVLIEAGAVTPSIDRTFPLARAARSEPPMIIKSWSGYDRGNS